MINKNKSESLSSRANPNRNTPSISSKEKGKRSEERKNQKPVIDLEIARGLDTLDRQEMKNFKKSLKASKEWNQLQKRDKNEENYVEEQIVCQDNFEENDSSRKKLKNTILADEIKEEIVECNDEESPNKYNPRSGIEEKKVVFEQGKTKTYIKPRPISGRTFNNSAVQKQQAPQNRSSQIIKNSQDSSMSFREQKNPFKKQPAPTNPIKRQDSLKLSNLMKRIKHFDYSQMEQLEIIMEKIERGEIESVEASNDVIKMNQSSLQQRPNQKSGETEGDEKEMDEREDKERNPFEHRSSIPTLVTLELPNKSMEGEEIESKIIENVKKSEITNHLVTEKSSDGKYSKVNKSQYKPSKDSLVLPPSSFKESLNKELKIQTRKQNTLAVKIISNWGHPKTIGLTKIQIFSKTGERLEVQESQIKGCSKRMLKLFSSNTPFTTNQSQMWISPSPEPPSVIVIEISLQVSVGALRIWNYNKSQIENSKGVKDIKVIANDEKWNGEIKKGCGNEYEDYSTLIKFTLNQGAVIPDVQLPLVEQPIQSMSIPLISKNSNNKWLEETLMKNQLMELTENKNGKQKQKQEKARPAENKIQRSGSYEIRKSGAKSSISQRGQTKEQKNQTNVEEALEHKKYLESEAESVKKDVEESLKKVRMNLLFGDDIITRDIENKKHAKTQNKKSRRDMSLVNPIQQEMLLEQRDSISNLRDKKTKLGELPEAIKSNYATHVPLNNHQRLQTFNKPSPIVNKRQEQEVYNVNNYVSNPKFQKQQNQEEPKSGNKLQIKDDRIKIVKQALTKNVSSIYNKNQEDDLGQFIKQLNNILPSHQPIKIQELPKGTKLYFNLLTNYGDPYYVGLSKIEIFDKHGNLLDIGFGQISGNCEQHPISNLINQNIKVYDKNSLWLGELRKSNQIVINLQVPTSISLIRIWNYNQSRIHNNRGVRIVSIQLDNTKIFQGQISKFNGEYNYEDCQYLVFTEDNNIIDKIVSNDWIRKIKDKDSDNHLKETITNFERPTTAEHEDIRSKENRDFNVPSNSKKYKNTYQTPTFPKGKCLEILLLSTWGDRHYVGLDQIEIFSNSKHNILSNRSNFKITAIPSSVSVLPGMAKDLRTVDKLVSGAPPKMWLSPMNSDMQRIENNINSITINFSKNETIGMINLWNYSKTPSRGVRQVVVILDDTIIYQGYVCGSEEKNYSSIAFTKDGDYLQQMKYQGYNEENMGQLVGLVNERNQVKSHPPQSYSEMERPFTSVFAK